MSALAVTTVFLTIQSIEVIHLLRVAYKTYKDGYKVGAHCKNVAQEKIQSIKDKKDPAAVWIREATTLYDFQSNTDPLAARHEIDKDARTYLDTLGRNLETLCRAKDCFNATYKCLKELVKASIREDEQNFLSHLDNLNLNFRQCKDQLLQFSLSIEPPDRKKLYIADKSNGGQVEAIEKFNTYSISIKKCFKELQAIKQDINSLIQNYLAKIYGASSSNVVSFEELKQSVRGYLEQPTLIPETMHELFSEHDQLINFCIDIAQIASELKPIDGAVTEQNDPWDDNPYWLPLLLTQEKQIKKGQLIFLELMKQNNIDTPSKDIRETKTYLAEIFLSKLGNKREINKIIVDLLSQELASTIVVEQRKKCSQLIEFLSESIHTNAYSPLLNTDEMRIYRWLETTRKTQTSVELLKEILVSPYLLSGYNIESLAPKLKELLPNENTDALLRKYRASHWGVIREKSDDLIQLPDSFKTKIMPNDRYQNENPSDDANRISTVRRELSEALIIELKTIDAALCDTNVNLNKHITALRQQAKETRAKQKNLAHEQGVERIKQAHRYFPSIDHTSNILYLCLHNPETINEVQKALQVPTLDDLEQVIYHGVDLHAVYMGETNANLKHRLLYFFYPKHGHDNIMGAYIYAIRECGVDVRTLIPLFSHPDKPLLAIGSGNEDTPSVIAVLKNGKKIVVPDNSLVFNNISSKTIQETELFLSQLDDYYNISLMRFRPELQQALPLKEKCKLLVQSLLHLGGDIRAERFDSVSIFMGKLNAVFTAEDITSINKTLQDLKDSYAERDKKAKKKYRSELYGLMNKAMHGCIAAMSAQLKDVAQEQFDLKEQNKRLEKQLQTFKEALEESEDLNKTLKVQLEQTDAQLKETAEQLAQNKEQFQAHLKQTDAKLENITAMFNRFIAQQPVSASDDGVSNTSNTQTSENNNSARFFKS